MKSNAFNPVLLARQLKEQKCTYPVIFRFLMNKKELTYDEATEVIKQMDNGNNTISNNNLFDI